MLEAGAEAKDCRAATRHHYRRPRSEESYACTERELRPPPPAARLGRHAGATRGSRWVPRPSRPCQHRTRAGRVVAGPIPTKEPVSQGAGGRAGKRAQYKAGACATGRAWVTWQTQHLRRFRPLWPIGQEHNNAMQRCSTPTRSEKTHPRMPTISDPNPNIVRVYR